eukprot:g1290.t1
MIRTVINLESPTEYGKVWRPIYDENTEETYYYNTRTGEVSWDNPFDRSGDSRRDSAEPTESATWESYVDSNTGKEYYYNKLTHETTWNRPGSAANYHDDASGKEGGGWQSAIDQKSGRTYYYNRNTGDVSWSLNHDKSRTDDKKSDAVKTDSDVSKMECNTFADVDFLGGDPGGYSGTLGSILDVEGCCEKCAENRECWGFAYDRESELCYLKTEAARRVPHKTGIISGTVKDRVARISGDLSGSSGTVVASGDDHSQRASADMSWTWDEKPQRSYSPFKFEVGPTDIWSFVDSRTSLNAPKVDIDMENVYDALPVGDPDGGAWKQGWDVSYDARAAKARTLYVHVVPHSHNDPGWIKTYSEYYHTQTKKILDSLVTTVSAKPTRKFIWAETSYFSRWWDDSPEHLRAKARKLIENKQLEIVTGGWVMNDEANPDIPAIIGQLYEGHKWLKDNLGVRPRHGWAIDPFGHTATMAYVLKRMGFDAMLIQRVYYAVKKKFARDQTLEFRWRQPWDTDGTTDMFCHMMPFYSYDVPHTCGPDPSVCCQFDFKRRQCPWKKSPVPITPSNVRSRAELLLDQWRKKASLYKTAHVLVPLGDDFRYTTEKECNAQFENFERIFDFFARERSTYNVVASFSTLADYFDGVKSDSSERQLQFPVVRGDFFTYADKTDEFWSGYYVTRSYYKSKCRVLFAQLRAAEILFTLHTARARRVQKSDPGDTARWWNSLSAARKNLALFMHHDGITGTAKNHVAVDYGKRMQEALDGSMSVIQGTLAALRDRDGESLRPERTFKKFDALPEREVLFASLGGIFRSGSETESVLIFNPLASRVTISSVIMHAGRTEVCVFGKREDDTWGPLPAQIAPVLGSKGDTVELFFEHVVPAFGFTTVQITVKASSCREDDRATLSKVAVRSDAVSQETRRWAGIFDVSALSTDTYATIRSDHVSAAFDVATGLLRSIRSGGKVFDVQESFSVYKTRRSGAYLFIPNGKPRSCCTASKMWHSTGTLVQQAAFETADGTVFREARLTRMGTAADALEMRHVLNWGSVHKDEEVVVRYATPTISNREMRFVTDENGFNPISRRHRPKLPLQANFFPMPTYAQRSDTSTGDRVTVHCDRALGVAAPRSDEFQVMLERRPSHDDQRGLGQGINDNVPTEITLRLLFEPYAEIESSYVASPLPVPLPSLRSKLLSMHSNYPTCALVVVGGGSSDVIHTSGESGYDWAPEASELPPFVHIMNWAALDSNGRESALTLHTHGVHDALSGRYGSKASGVDIDMTRWLKRGVFDFQRLVPADLSLGDTLQGDNTGVYDGHVRLRYMEVQAFRASLA